LDRAHLAEAEDDQEVENRDGGNWNGEAERERVPNERLFSGHHLAFRPLDRTRYVTMVLHRPAHVCQ